MNQNKIQQLQLLIKNAQKIVVLTGAGISCASNIPDFRSSNGLYQTSYAKMSPEEILSHHFFLEHPDDFYQFYFDKMLYPNALPNISHLVLAELEEKGKDITIITQNIDGLHQKAGSKNVIELHGSVLRNHCQKCHAFYSLDDLLQLKPLPRCPKCGGLIKPDVVLYEEPLDERNIDQALKKVKDATLLLIIGTSLLVNPAASLPYYFSGEHLVIINLDKTPLDQYAKLVFHDKAEDIFQQLKGDTK